MIFAFASLLFEEVDGALFLKCCGDMESRSGRFVEIQVAGEEKPSHAGAKLTYSSEGKRLRYLSHRIEGDRLEIVQRSEKVEVKSVFCAFAEGRAFSVYNEVTNVSGGEIVLEDVSSLVLSGIGKEGTASTKHLYFTRFVQSHHLECQAHRASFLELGMLQNKPQPLMQKRIAFANIGSWSTKEELPQGIVEDTERGSMLMFEIESNSSWYYEISDRDDEYYLYLGGANQSFSSWHKALAVGETYRTKRVGVSLGSNLEEVVGAMTVYRRAIRGTSAADSTLPAIFNEYMHLSWDSPTAENVRKYAPVVARTGVEFYVIDCGWHNEEDGDKVYPFVGQWKESHARFPKGVRETTDYIRSLGMKPGLWIEPEVVGVQCREMLEYYGDECFLQRNGRPIAVMGRRFLDYRHPKVVSYMSETIRRMVEDYGAEYIKFDYNQDLGVGCARGQESLGEGLESAANAFLTWVEEMKARFPQVVFEGCASGGMRTDYQTLSVFSLLSTSDQTDYLKYPYVAGNVFAAALPEQAAIWSYPVGECTSGETVSDDRIVMNMVNSLLGRMHLASHLEYLDERQLALIQEGVARYKEFAAFKQKALPYFPCGFARFGDNFVAAGLRDRERILLAVWCMGEERQLTLNLDGPVKTAEIAYPSWPNATLATEGKSLTLTFARGKTACLVEINCL